MPQVDEIILLENGSIVEVGTYEQLMQSESSKFASFMKNFLESNAPENGNNLLALFNIPKT